MVIEFVVAMFRVVVVGPAQATALKPCRPVAFGVQSFISGWLGPCHEDDAQT